MKKRYIVIIAVVLLAAICLGGSMFTVRENEYGCTVRMSNIISTTDAPGMHFKVPFIDSV